MALDGASLEEFKSQLRRYKKIFREAAQEKLNEADTVSRVMRFCEDGLGYDGFKEVSREYAVKGTFVDLALKVDGEPRIFVEVKAAGGNLRESHTQQAQNYAANRGVSWVLLTNGVEWILYRVEVQGAIEAIDLFRVNILEDPTERIVGQLGLLHRRAFGKGAELERYWQHRRALSGPALVRALASENVIAAVRKEIRADSGVNLPDDDIFAALRSLLQNAASPDLIPSGIRRKLKPVKTEDDEPSAPAVG